MLKKCLMAMALAGVTASHAFAPHTGTWIVTSEANGKPGRGLAIDVQGNTLVMQMYAYDANGNATFYMTSGTIANNQFSSALNKYRGGRYVGSGDLIGQDAGSAGTVSLRFDSGTTGFITLPGEPEKAINRFSFAYGSSPQSLKGAWLLTPLSSTNPQSDYMFLVNENAASQYGSGMVTTQDNRFGCENLVSGPNAGTVACVKLNASNQVAQVYYFKYMVNDGEGLTGPTMEKANISLSVRRVTDPNGFSNGIWLKSEAASERADPAVLLEAIEQAAAVRPAE